MATKVKTGVLGTLTELNFADNGKARFGAGNDLQIFHDGSNSYIKEEGPGALVLQSNSNIVLEKIIQPPPPVEKLPEILPVEPIKFDPIPEPMVQEIEDIQPDIANTIPMQNSTVVPEKSIDVRAQQKVIESYGALLTRHISAFKKYPFERIGQKSPKFIFSE